MIDHKPNVQMLFVATTILVEQAHESGHQQIANELSRAMIGLSKAIWPSNTLERAHAAVDHYLSDAARWIKATDPMTVRETIHYHFLIGLPQTTKRDIGTIYLN